MFKKLMKLEWKETWKLITFLLFAMILCSLVGGIIISIGGGLCSADSTDNFFNNLMLFCMLLGYSAQLVLPFFAFLRLCQYFQSSMYTHRGYLTHTLPVKKSELMGAKVTMSFLWIILISLATFLSYLMLQLLAHELTTEELISFFHFTLQPEIFDIETGETIIIADSYLFPVTFMVILLGIMALLMIVYTAMTLGQMALHNKVAVSIGTGAVMYALLMVIGMKAGQIMTRFSMEPSQNNFLLMKNTLLLSMVVLILIIAGLYMINVKVLKKHLNLD